MEPHAQRGLELLDDLVAALQGPLTASERANGWTEEKRERWFSFYLGFRSGFRAATGAGTAHGLARDLDFDGIGAGSDILLLVAKVEHALSASS